MASGIGISVKKVIDETNKVLAEVDKQTAKNLKAVGAETRKVARRSIRKKQKPSAPGRPPRSVVGTLRRTIFFWIERNQAVITGPIHLPGSTSNIPEVLEHGGTSRSKRRSVGRRRFYSRTIQARPYMGPAFTKTRDDIRNIWKPVGG